MTVIFDTLKLAKELRDEAGFPQQQAEGLATALSQTTSDTLATKTDIAEVKAEIADLRSEMKTEIAEVRAEIADLRTELKSDIARLENDIAQVRTEMQQMKAELLKWFIAIISGQALFIVTIIKLL